MKQRSWSGSGCATAAAHKGGAVVVVSYLGYRDPVAVSIVQPRE
jgi:hypothetical protein